MRRLTKKLAASVLACTLVIAMSAQCFAATWGSWFGANEGWYEGAKGTVVSQSATGWTVNLEPVGWGGVWGGQIFQDATKGVGNISVKKGQQYTLSFTMKSSNCDKWVYIKISTGETLAFNDWIQLKKNTDVNYSKTFTAKADANSIYFGVGGDYGDRMDVASDTDAKVRYAALPNYATVLANDANHDPTMATRLTLTKFSLGAAKPAKVSLKSVKAAKGGKVKVTYKKVTGAAGYQIQYSLKKNMKAAKSKTTKKATYTIKKLKKGKKYYVRVRAYNKGKKAYGDWSKKKSVKVK
ncbi:MAG: fibronectin type III domain-containing protein [Eubacterium sp.]